MDDLSSIVEKASRWIDSTLATGLKGMSSDHHAKGEELCDELIHCGFNECGKALRSVLRSTNDDQLDFFGELIVVLELTRESLEIHRLQSSTD